MCRVAVREATARVQAAAEQQLQNDPQLLERHAEDILDLDALFDVSGMEDPDAIDLDLLQMFEGSGGAQQQNMPLIVQGQPIGSMYQQVAAAPVVQQQAGRPPLAASRSVDESKPKQMRTNKRRGKKTPEEIAEQVERVKRRRRESAQRSRNRKCEYMKNLETENQALKEENERLRKLLNQKVSTESVKDVFTIGDESSMMGSKSSGEGHNTLNDAFGLMNNTKAEFGSSNALLGTPYIEDAVPLIKSEKASTYDTLLAADILGVPLQF
jgi:hypothetical protein